MAKKNSGPNSPLATLIRIEMERLNMSNYYLAEKMGVDLSTVTNWRQGRYRPNEELIGKLAKVLRVEVSTLLERF